MRITDRLSSLGVEITQAKTEIRILEEQLEFVGDVADDARIRAVVSETPIADRDAREAADDAARMRRSLDDARVHLATLLQEQDRLLERLFEESGTS